MAMDRLLKIATFAEGEYGDYVEQKVVDLFWHHSEVVIKNWATVKRYEAEIGFATSDYCANADTIIAGYQNTCGGCCNIDAPLCAQIIEFLKQKKQECEQYE